VLRLLTVAGAKVGSTTVDRQFWDFCSKIFGSSFDNMPIKDRTSGSKFMKEFDDIKLEFQGAHVDDVVHRHTVPLKMKKVDIEDKNVKAHWDEDDRHVVFTSWVIPEFPLAR
jgi:hypothetical protein